MVAESSMRREVGGAIRHDVRVSFACWTRIDGAQSPRLAEGSDTIPETATERPCDSRGDKQTVRDHEVLTMAGAAHARRSTTTATIWPSRQSGHTRSETPVSASTRSR